MSPKITGAGYWHINADEQVAYDYNLEFKQPACATCAPDPANAARLQDRLWVDHRIEVPVRAHDGRLWVRLSAQVYNDISDYEALASAVSEP